MLSSSLHIDSNFTEKITLDKSDGRKIKNINFGSETGNYMRYAM